ncbi:MAG: SGNH/GDSL hydrolase family protein [Calditrichia bacterium]
MSKNESLNDAIIMGKDLAEKHWKNRAGIRKKISRNDEPKGILIAEGDSWFDYPGSDVLDILEDKHNYRIEHSANKGDKAESMAYDSSQIKGFIRILERLLRRDESPKAVLLSAGGNDIAGDEFTILLNHAKSPKPGLSPEIMSAIINKRLRYCYITLISRINTLCEKHFGTKCPILVHGYDFAVPDGRGFWGGGWILPGPWLQPGFRKKGYPDKPLQYRTDLVEELINQFNDMLATLNRIRGFELVTYVNLRGKLPNDKKYKTWWANELHPTKKGFVVISDEIAKTLEQV